MESVTVESGAGFVPTTREDLLWIEEDEDLLSLIIPSSEEWSGPPTLIAYAKSGQKLF